jgi:tight adherence protein C
MIKVLLKLFAARHDLLPYLSMAGLIGGGIVLLIWGAGISSALPARRLNLVRRGSDAPRGVTALSAAGPKDGSAAWYAQGLTPEEQWQIVRSLRKFGVPASWSVAIFAATRFLLAVSAGAAAYLAAPGEKPMLPQLIGAGSAIAGYMLPALLIGRQLKRHRQSVGAGLPDALELLAICVGAGLSLENAFQRVSAELKFSRPALSDELALTWADITISPSRDQALANLAARVNLPTVRSIIGTLSQSLRFGTPLVQSLRTAASEMRNQQMIELEEKANRLPAMLTIPVILFIMPSIFLIAGGPAAIKLMDTFGTK